MDLVLVLWRVRVVLAVVLYALLLWEFVSITRDSRVRTRRQMLLHTYLDVTDQTLDGGPACLVLDAIEERQFAHARALRGELPLREDPRRN